MFHTSAKVKSYQLIKVLSGGRAPAKSSILALEPCAWKSSIFVLRQFFVFIFDHSFKGAYAGCCCLLAACLLLACCLCLLACCLCLLLLARCCCLPAAACLLLFACCCLPAAAGLLRCASRSWTALKKFVLSCQRLRVGVQPARNIHIPSLCWCLQPVPPASAKQGDRD